jgi:hypothetical protein
LLVDGHPPTGSRNDSVLQNGVLIDHRLESRPQNFRLVLETEAILNGG